MDDFISKCTETINELENILELETIHTFAQTVVHYVQYFILRKIISLNMATALRKVSSTICRSLPTVFVAQQSTCQRSSYIYDYKVCTISWLYKACFAGMQAKCAAEGLSLSHILWNLKIFFLNIVSINARFIFIARTNIYETYSIIIS